MSETREQRLAGIRERESRATSGDWRSGTMQSSGVHSVAPEWDWPTHRGGGRTIADKVGTLADAEFIAHARADIPYLLSALDSESERVLLEAAKAVCSYCRDNIPLDGTRIHRYSTGMFMDTCKAHAIHDLRSKGESR